MRFLVLALVCSVVVSGVPKPQRDGRVVYLNQHLYPSLLYINSASGSSSMGGSTRAEGDSEIIQLILYPATPGPPDAKKATVLLGHGDATGTLTLIQDLPPTGPTRIEGTVKGLTPGLHGFHIHQLGDLSNGCVSAGGHYNPYKQTHGSPIHIDRHVGDLGNILADDFGVAPVNISDPLVSLVGPRAVVGRAIVVHSGEDDLGQGGNEGSLSTGNAGGRVGCGIIGYA